MIQNQTPILKIKHIMVLHGLNHYMSARNKIMALNRKLRSINKTIIKNTEISTLNYCMLFEIEPDQVYKALLGNHILFLNRKHICLIENKKTTNNKPYLKAKALINKTIMTDISIFDYADLYDIPLDYILNQLNPKNHTKA